MPSQVLALHPCHGGADQCQQLNESAYLTAVNATDKAVLWTKTFDGDSLESRCAFYTRDSYYS